MRKSVWVMAGAGLIAGVATVAILSLRPPEFPDRDLSDLTGDVNRGAYVARLSGCIACHTDVKSGGAVIAGGAAIDTDFGRFYAPNITPHPEGGIGNWTLADFARALTDGLDPEGQHYFPSFPYTFYTHLSDQDIVDLWAAVRSVPPVAGSPPEHALRFPFGFRSGVAIWKAIFFDRGEFEPIDGRSEEWNRGRYLAEGPAHCGACHTPRNILGGRRTDSRYAGGTGPGAEKISAITPEALTERGWAKDDLVYALRTGIEPDGDVFGGSMVEVVREGTRFWSDADLSALIEYLMDPDVRGSSSP